MVCCKVKRKTFFLVNLRVECFKTFCVEERRSLTLNSFPTLAMVHVDVASSTSGAASSGGAAVVGGACCATRGPDRDPDVFASQSAQATGFCPAEGGAAVVGGDCCATRGPDREPDVSATQSLWLLVLAPPKVVLPSWVVFAAPLAAPTARFHEDFCIAASAVSLIVLVDVPLAALTARFLEFFCIAISAVLR